VGKDIFCTISLSQKVKENSLGMEIWGGGISNTKISKESMTGVGGFKAKKDLWSGRIFSGTILTIVIFKIIFKIINGMAN